MASTPRVAPTNEVVETNGARTCASGVLFWAARVPYCRCGIHLHSKARRPCSRSRVRRARDHSFHLWSRNPSASMPRTQHFTSFTDSLTGPANTSRLSACTLGRRTRGRTALDKIGIPWPILQSWWRVAWDDWLRMS